MLRISRLRVPKWSGNIVKYAKLQRMNISPNWSRALSSAGDSSSSSSGSVNSSSSGSGSPGDSLQTTISATDLSSNPTSDAALSSSNDFINVAEELVTTVPDLGWSPKDLAMQYIDWSHIFLDIPYWQAIIAATALLRVVILPISIKSQINAARMATLRPEMEKLNEIVKKDPLFASGDMATKARYQAEFQAMFKRHQVNPIRSMILPFIQLPLFVSFFLALRDMGNLYPGFETGGDFWFSNLALPDPMWILPAYNSLSFLFMVEMGSAEVNAANPMFKMVMRGLAVVMGPLTATFPAGLLVYWCTNNSISVLQSSVLKNKAVMSAMGIPEAPKQENLPKLNIQSPFKKITDTLEKQSAQAATARAEIVDGTMPPPPPSMSEGKGPVSPDEPIPVTFTTKPKKKK